jgi:hypothetical protein
VLIGPYRLALLRSGCHLLALFCALAASLGTSLAVVHFVLPALFGTLTARLSADAAHFFSQGAITGHQYRSEGAEISAIAVQLDAARHHFHVVFA